MAEPENLVVSRIGNAEAIREHFGHWPSFHDAEITRVVFDANPGYHASVTFFITVSATYTHVDDRGHHKQTKQCDIELQFVGIKELEVDYFGHQNVIFELLLEEQGSDIKCTFDASVGMDAFIVAEEVRVAGLTPRKQ
ncbi:Imm50 family immunity protein [Solirubrum puertoriconensis]|uniref:Uncharacterized protein n=1 Tax=Solirubrum puertoriconensis TaxID=1751427 RepID=A0A9X0HHB5_SOLP1|nr:Imm50 family immunity protein [Solirubrum puertoriconensis]KUG05911.1 hypothetical protein ASU33_00545 [Solirubrum puertoriconensis]